jgi:hypothetical protein
MRGDRVVLMTLIADLVSFGFKYHSRKSDKFHASEKRFAYHVYMMELYTDILALTLKSDKLRERYLK